MAATERLERRRMLSVLVQTAQPVEDARRVQAFVRQFFPGLSHWQTDPDGTKRTS